MEYEEKYRKAVRAGQVRKVRNMRHENLHPAMGEPGPVGRNSPEEPEPIVEEEPQA